MNPETFKPIFGIICCFGFILMIGTVGASDCENISLGRAIIQASIGLAMFGGAGYFGGFMK